MKPVYIAAILVLTLAISSRSSAQSPDQGRIKAESERKSAAPPPNTIASTIAGKQYITSEEKLLQDLMSEMYMNKSEPIVALLQKYGFSRKAPIIPEDATAEQSKERLRSLSRDIIQLAPSDSKAATLVEQFHLSKTAKPTVSTGDRFAVNGLKTGITVDELNDFLRANTLKPAGESDFKNVTSSARSFPIRYLSEQAYSNGKTGTDQLNVKLKFTAPYGNVPSKVWRIDYETFFGDGVDYKAVAADVRKRYGKPQIDDTSAPIKMQWWTNGRSDSFPDFAFEVWVHPSNTAGTPGSLTFQIRDEMLWEDSTESAKRHLNGLENARQKDTTKPKF